MTDQTSSPDGAAPLDSLEAIAGCLADAFESGDAEAIAAALGRVAQAPALAELAAAASVPRAELQASLASGALSLETTLAIMKVIDLHLPPRSFPH